jgi:hypothetical protein
LEIANTKKRQILKKREVSHEKMWAVEIDGALQRRW